MSGFRGKSCWLTRVLATALILGAALPAAIWHHHETTPACDFQPSAAKDPCHPDRSTPNPQSKEDPGSCHLCLAAHLVAVTSPACAAVTFEKAWVSTEAPVSRVPCSRVLHSLHARAPPA